MNAGSVTLCLCSLIGACAVGGVRLPEARLVRDLHALYRELESTHPDLFHQHSRQEWNDAVTRLASELPKMRRFEAVAAFRRLMSLSGDAHTAFYYPPTKGAGFETRYAIEIDVFADGVHVVRAERTASAAVGRRVLAINGVPTRSALARIRPVIVAGNELWALRWIPTFLQVPGIVAGQGLSDALGDPLVLTLADADGGRFDVTVHARRLGAEIDWVEAGPVDLRSSLRHRSRRNYWFHHDERRGFVYVQFRAVADEPDETFAAFCRRLFDFVESSSVDRLVLDLRDNGGGNNYLNQPLLHGLIRCRKLSKPGHLYVVVGRRTFSAAMNLAAEIETNTNAVFVGEPTGGAPNHFGDPKPIELPALGLTAYCSTVRWMSSSDPRDTRPWILPDLPAPPRFSDRLAGRDSAIEAIVADGIGRSWLLRSPRTNWQRPSQGRGWPSYFEANSEPVPRRKEQDS